MITSKDYFQIRMDDSPNPIDQSENISRFILSKRYIATSRNKARYNVFQPYPHVELSVYRISRLLEDKIWKIGRKMVAQPQNKTIEGRADFLAARAIENKLSIIPERKTHKLHANIVDWPENKAKQKLIAAKLADEAELKLPS